VLPLRARTLDMYQYRTRIGTFSIRHLRERWHVFFEDENLGNYANPRQALDDLVAGRTVWPSFKARAVDPSTLGIADELSEWKHSTVRD
jgi:hypothetical protein